MYIANSNLNVSLDCEQVVNVVLESDLVLKTCRRLHYSLYLSRPPSLLIFYLLMEKCII